MQRLVLLMISAFVLAACAEGQGGLDQAPVANYEPPPPGGGAFDAADFAWSTAAGPGSIAGTLAYHRDGVRYSCEGGDVLLTPESAWSRRRMFILYGSATAAAVPLSIVRARTSSAGTGDYARFVRRTTCDAANHFSFHGLPNGGWFVITIGKPADGTGEPMALTRRVETHGAGASVVL